MKLGDLEALRGVVKFPVRIKCATLSWNTLLQALDETADRVVPGDDEPHGRVEPASTPTSARCSPASSTTTAPRSLWKASGLTQAQLAQPLPPSTLTLGGLVKHLALVEDSWFTERFAGQPDAGPVGRRRLGGRPRLGVPQRPPTTPPRRCWPYAESCERSRAVYAAAESLDQRSVVGTGGPAQPFTLRWIMHHMIEETARHNGHVDLLREAIDGVTGE